MKRHASLIPCGYIIPLRLRLLVGCHNLAHEVRDADIHLAVGILELVGYVLYIHSVLDGGTVAHAVDEEVAHVHELLAHFVKTFEVA